MIPLPLSPKIVEKKEKNKAVFEFEALYPGYGITIGNSLRRVLLSSLPGAAVTEMKIKDTEHEFSTVDGVLEDVIRIMLNLKRLRFRMHSDEPQRALLKIKGEKRVVASDLKLPTQVEIINKDAHILTLTDKKAEIDMEILIEKGVGYEPAERRKREKMEIGVIALDAIFTPIKKVSFRVENMRVGRRIDFDKLILEIETDGTMGPEEALRMSSEILADHFALINESIKGKSAKKPSPAKGQKKGEKKEPKGKPLTKIEELGLSAKTTNILIQNSIKTAAGLLRKKEETLMGLKGMGEKGVKEIKKVLKKQGLKIKE